MECPGRCISWYRPLLVLVLVFCSINPTGGTVDSGMTCEELEERVEEADRRTEIIFPPPITGKWVSEKCEIRAGPEYTLRSHQFHDNWTFESRRWFYRDQSCSHPLYSVAVAGVYGLRGRSWLTPGATRADYAPYYILIIPFTQQIADELAVKVNASCPNTVKRRWRPHQEYMVLNVPPDKVIKGNDGELEDGGEGWLECARGVYKEGALVRVQKRPGGLLPHAPRPSTQLLLGELRPRSGATAPTTFRAPLVRPEQWESCEVCRTVSRGTATSPPLLPIQPRTPPHLAGEWLSVSCEARPLGLFLRRNLKVSGNSWRAEYKFFSDPLCSTPSLTATAEGHFRPANLPVVRIPGATDFDFNLERAYLALHDQGLVQNLQGGKACGGPGLWQVGVVRDLTPSKGCPPLGITVPSTEYELVRVEVDPLGNTMLLLGQSDPNRAKAPKHRPTAFQPPLLQCDAPDLPPLTHFLNGFNRGAATPKLNALLFPPAALCILSALR